MSTPAPSTLPELSPSVFKYRVMVGEEIVGTFSNLPLATETALVYHG